MEECHSVGELVIRLIKVVNEPNQIIRIGVAKDTQKVKIGNLSNQQVYVRENSDNNSIIVKNSTYDRIIKVKPYYIGREDFPQYEGEYVITPKVSAQFMETKDKLMAENVEVKAIPISRVVNSGGGKTVYIG